MSIVSRDATRLSGDSLVRQRTENMTPCGNNKKTVPHFKDGVRFFNRQMSNLILLRSERYGPQWS